MNTFMLGTSDTPELLWDSPSVFKELLASLGLR
jgi:hypothetical protein